jgi:hypothetical protein
VHRIAEQIDATLERQGPLRDRGGRRFQSSGDGGLLFFVTLYLHTATLINKTCRQYRSIFACARATGCEGIQLASIEENSDDWRELRSRVDSIANAIFLIAGGALSLSMTVILGQKGEEFITEEVVQLSTGAWYGLLSSVILFLVLKAYLVYQAFMLQCHPDFVTKHLRLFNTVGWSIGIVGFASFIYGLVRMVQAAVQAVGA